MGTLPEDERPVQHMNAIGEASVQQLIGQYVQQSSVVDEETIRQVIEKSVSRKDMIEDEFVRRTIEKAIAQKDRIDAAAVSQLRDVVYHDAKISQRNADFLFRLKDRYLDKVCDDGWKDFFVDAITDYLLNDEKSPGDIDDDEARWLRARIQYNGRLDEIEKCLLLNLKKKATNYPDSLYFESERAKRFEKLLLGSRFVALLAVMGSLLASMMLFTISTRDIFQSIFKKVNITAVPLNAADGVAERSDTFSPGPHEVRLDSRTHSDDSIKAIVKSVDGYLFAIALLIFSIGVYRLFVNKIDVVNEQKKTHPAWLAINSIEKLQSLLGEVLLMILIVYFFEHSLELGKRAQFKTPQDLLYLGVGILLISVSLYLTHRHAEKKEKG